MQRCFIVSLLLFAARPAVSEDIVTVHEWGTFTSLQDERGDAIGGINTDDEPVPKFVNNLQPFLLIKPGQLPPTFYQGAPHCHPDVTLRLETPVIYFYPPGGEVRTLDLKVGFQGGWITEFYPEGTVEVPGLTPGWVFQFGPLQSTTRSTLTWPSISVGGDWTGPETNAHVWLAPRAVKAASVKTSGGQAEKFLFYRGVGHVDACLRVVRDTASDVLRFETAARTGSAAGSGILSIGRLWLAHLRQDGTGAFRRMEWKGTSTASAPGVMTAPASFEAGEFAPGNVDRLRSELRDALLAQGLFGDEAEAVLKTWELSYFKSAGLRVFFVVPRPWVDQVLPLEFSMPVKLTRVMVGRIELVTPEQRKMLREIAAGPAPNIARWRNELYSLASSSRKQDRDAFSKITSDREPPPREQIPPLYQTYLSLGRFRNALILEEQKRRPTPALEAFIKVCGLEAFEVPRQ